MTALELALLYQFCRDPQWQTPDVKGYTVDSGGWFGKSEQNTGDLVEVMKMNSYLNESTEDLLCSSGVIQPWSQCEELKEQDHDIQHRAFVSTKWSPVICALFSPCSVNPKSGFTVNWFAWATSRD